MSNHISRINHQDPNVLVSIAAQKIGMKTLLDDSDWARAATNIDAVNGISTNPETYKLLYGVLEATACLSVSEDRLQVVAVALHIGQRWGGTPMLTIAENNDLRPGLAEHITQLWSTLRDMSKIGDETDPTFQTLKNSVIRSVYGYSISKNLRRYNKWMPRVRLFARLLQATDLGSTEFDHHVQSLESTHRDLCNILAHVKSPAAETSWIDLVERVEKMDVPQAVAVECKKWLETLNWMSALPSIEDDVEGELVDNEKWADGLKIVTDKLRGQEFQEVSKSVKSKCEFLQKVLAAKKSVSSRVHWDGLIKRMDGIINVPDEKVRNWEVWATMINWAKLLPKFKGEPGIVEGEIHDFMQWITGLTKGTDSLPVCRALGKLTTQDRHMKRLFSAAIDVTLNPLFVSAMGVRGVPETKKVPITLPRTEAELQSIVRAMYESIKPKITKRLIDMQVEELSKFLEINRKNNPYQGVVHCECALVAYLENPLHKLPGQFNYIGVSKLSCGACHSWLMAFNSTRHDDLKYYTAGTHGKWYHPWAIPPSLASAGLKDQMAKIVCEQFVRYCNPGITEKKMHDLSGSTHAKAWSKGQGKD